MSNAPRRLVVMRHATAEPVAASDMERALTSRGRDDAAAAGTWLATLGFTPDHALVSSAVRTRETWSAMASAAGWHLEPDVDTGLYAAGPEVTLDLVRAVPPDAQCVVVVGHNPTVSQVALLLSDGLGNRVAARALAHGYPPGACTVFDVTEEWSRLAFGDGHLVDFHVGGRA